MLRTLLEKVFKAPSVRDFKSIEALEKTGKPNQALLIPAHWNIQDYIGPQLLPTHAPHYTLPPKLLFEDIVKHFDATPDCQQRYLEQEHHKAVYCARTAFMRYPDMIYIHVVAADSEQETSTFAAYGHSIYGYSDLGVNAKRLKQLVESLGKWH